MVFHIAAGADWKKAFHHILTEPSAISCTTSKTAVIQEQAIGTEYAVGTVSARGKHYLAHLIKYNKTSVGDRKTVFDYVEFVPFDKTTLGELFEYTQKTLDALGVRFWFVLGGALCMALAGLALSLIAFPKAAVPGHVAPGYFTGWLWRSSCRLFLG